MKKIETSNFEFLTFDRNNLEHLEVLSLLKRDDLVKKYLKFMLDYMYYSDIDKQDFTGNYMVMLNDKIVGFVNISNHFYYGTYNYGLLKNYRGMRLYKDSIAATMTNELLNELFNQYNSLLYFKACIDKMNIRSIKMAEKCGFICIGNNNGKVKEYYRYR